MQSTSVRAVAVFVLGVATAFAGCALQAPKKRSKRPQTTGHAPLDPPQPEPPKPVLGSVGDAPTLVVKQGAWFAIGPEGAAAAGDGKATLSLHDVAIDPKSGALLAAASAGAAKGGIVASADGGVTWRTLREGDGCDKVRADGQGTTYALCGAQLVSSTDDGKTWTTLELPKTRDGSAKIVPEQLEVSPKRPARVYVSGKGGTQSDGLYWTEDGGKTWASMEHLIDGRGEGATADGDPAQRVYGLAMHPANPDLVVALFMFGVYVSEDGGKTFTEETVYKPTAAAWPSAYGDAVRPQRASRVYFDVAEPKTVYASRGDSVVVTRDGGQSWQEHVVAKDEIGDTLVVHALVAHPSVSGALYAHTGDDLHVSTDFGATWTKVQLATIPPEVQATAFKGFAAPPAEEPMGYTSLHFQAFDADDTPPFLVVPASGRIVGGTSQGFLELVGAP